MCPDLILAYRDLITALHKRPVKEKDVERLHMYFFQVPLKCSLLTLSLNHNLAKET